MNFHKLILSAPPDPLAGFNGPTSKGRGRNGRGEEEEGRGPEGRGEEGSGGKGKERKVPKVTPFKKS